VGAEIDDQGGSLIDTGDRAKTVLVVGDLVAYREALGRRLRVGRAERTGGQVTPGTGGVMAHCHQYAPNSGAGLQGSYAWPGSWAASGPAAAVSAAGSGLAVRPVVWRWRSTCA